MLEITVKFRKRREEGRDNLQQIKVNFEAVFIVQGKGDKVDSGRSGKNSAYCVPIFQTNFQPFWMKLSKMMSLLKFEALWTKKSIMLLIHKAKTTTLLVN